MCPSAKRLCLGEYFCSWLACTLSFASEALLQEHIVQPHVCEWEGCKKTCDTQEAMELHYVSAHGCSRCGWMGDCGGRLWTRDDLSRHIQEEHLGPAAKKNVFTEADCWGEFVRAENKHGRSMPIGKFTKGSEVKVFIQCWECGHISKGQCAYTIADGCGCNFCGGTLNSFCDDFDGTEQSCPSCYRRSFASVPLWGEFVRAFHKNRPDISLAVHQFTRGSKVTVVLKCPVCQHHSKGQLASDITRYGCNYCKGKSDVFCDDFDGTERSCSSCYHRSFASVSLWGEFVRAFHKDYPDISLAVHQFTRSSGTVMVVLKCPVCQHVSKGQMASGITNEKGCNYCGRSSDSFCDDFDGTEHSCSHCHQRSFARVPLWGEFVRASHKDYPDISLAVHQFTRCSNKVMVVLKCPTCQHDSKGQRAADVTGEKECNYCGGTSDSFCDDFDGTEPSCSHCYHRSFASVSLWGEFVRASPVDHPDISLAVHQFTRYSHKVMVVLKCSTCQHCSKGQCATNVTCGNGCNYCGGSSDSFCDDFDGTEPSCSHCYQRSFASVPLWGEFVRAFHKDRPDISLAVHQFTRSSGAVRVVLKCPVCQHCSKGQSANEVTRGNGCANCRHKTERLVHEFLLFGDPHAQRNVRFDWCRNPATGRHLPFDLCSHGGILTEIDGGHHFRTVYYARKLLQDIVDFDAYKVARALSNGRHLRRSIQEDVWGNRFDWRQWLVCTEQLLQTEPVPCLILPSDDASSDAIWQPLLDALQAIYSCLVLLVSLDGQTVRRLELVCTSPIAPTSLGWDGIDDESSDSDCMDEEN